MGFPGGSEVKASACNVGDLCLIPGLEDPLEKEMLHSPVFLPGKSHGQRSLVSYSPWGRKESDTTERLHLLSYLVSSPVLVSTKISEGTKGLPTTSHFKGAEP